jgi:hypothetical protein
VPQFLPRSKKLRTALYAGGALVFVGIVAAILVITADSGTKHAAGTTTTKPKKQVVADAKKESLKLVVGKVVVADTGFPTKMRPPVQHAVMAATQRYFDDAIQAPLRNGKVKAAYSRVFDAGVSALAARRDRAALTDAATGPLRSPIRIASSRVRIDVLGDQSGKPILVSTSFSLQVNARTPTARLKINRHTELTFAYESGRWRVTAYRVTVRRTLGPKTTKTTVHSPGTTS